MLFSRDYKIIARECLQGRWGAAVLAGMVATLLGASIRISIYAADSITTLFEAEESYEYILEYVEYYVGSELLAEVLPYLNGFLIGLAVLFGIRLVVGGAMTLGYAQFHLNLVDGYANFSDIFSHFRRMWEGICMQFFQAMLVFLWSCLLVVPGIVASYRYALTPYILAEDKELSVMEAIGESKQLMYGHKWQLFRLDLSFIGWYLLSEFTMGLSDLWAGPYKEAARAAFYRELTEERYSNPYIIEE